VVLIFYCFYSKSIEILKDVLIQSRRQSEALMNPVIPNLFRNYQATVGLNFVYSLILIPCVFIVCVFVYSSVRFDFLSYDWSFVIFKILA
jgi:hypothetical protein